MLKYYGSNTTPLPPKRKEDNKKENKRSKEEKKFIPPSLEEIEKYVLEKQLKVNAKQFYNYFTEGKWVDSKGNPVRSWKQKILTWNGYSHNTKQEKKGNFKGRDYAQSELDSLLANNNF